MNDAYKNLNENNQVKKKQKLLIALDDIIADMISNKKFKQIVAGLFIRGRNLSVSLVFITQSYFLVPKYV